LLLDFAVILATMGINCPDIEYTHQRLKVKGVDAGEFRHLGINQPVPPII
jgi:hypothetical protein